MIFQQFGGINAMGFYASEIFEEAGKHVLVFFSIENIMVHENFPQKRPGKKMDGLDL